MRRVRQAPLTPCLARAKRAMAHVALVGLAAALSIGGLAMAQPDSGALLRPYVPREGLRRVEQGVADAGPLSISLRDLSGDLRTPDAFRDVYRLPDSVGRRAGQFARVSGNGGIIAVYPRGTYTPTSNGLRADVPPGTIFYLGGIPPDPPGLGPMTGPSGAIALRIDPRLDVGEAGPVERGVITPRIEPIATRLSTRILPATTDALPDLARGALAPPSAADIARAADAREQRLREREAELLELGGRLFSDPEFRSQRIATIIRGRAR